jgi:hypothetical protein
MMENGRGKERKINSEPAMPILVADGEGGLKQNLREMDGSLTYVLFTKPLNVMYCSVRYSRRPVCKYPHLVYYLMYTTII